MTYRILSFCGGGIRGLLSAGLLNRLAQQFPTIVSKADLLAGTSTGSDIVSLILANKTPAEIYDYYVNEAPKAFEVTNPIRQQPAYDIGKLVEAQLLLHRGNPPLNSLKPNVLFTAFNVGGAKVNWGPLLLHNLPHSTTGDTRLVDAVVSSSAMPGMYGSYGGNVDGAFVNHDPTLAAIALAVSHGHSLNRIIPENDINPDDRAYLAQQVTTVNLTDALNVLRDYWH